MTLSTLQYFDIYTQELNWKVIPLRPNSKKPISSGWSRKTYDLFEARRIVVANPKCNIGLLLGEIVDVEADYYFSINLLKKLATDHKHPRFKSNKSTHHLFLNQDDNLTRRVFHGIEFRGYKHQSVLPPSKIKGIKYQWLELSLPVTNMPDRLLNFFSRMSKSKNQNWANPLCQCCGEKSRPVHIKRYRKEISEWDIWKCHKCRKEKTPVI